VIEAANDADIQLFIEATSYNPTSQFKAIVMKVDGEIQAMTGYDYWTPNAVQMHIWIKHPEAYLSKEFIQESFGYPFSSGRNLVIGVTPGDNERALSFNQKIGFKEKYRIKDGWSLGTDMVIQEMRLDECRWLSRRSRNELVQQEA
jgi:RimJ/RimL family protein N-acetyltransferase